MLNIHINPVCTICYSEYTEKKGSTPFIFVNCGHTMCQTCINQTKVNNKPQCAFCKKKGKIVINKQFLNFCKNFDFNCQKCYFPFNGKNRMPIFFGDQEKYFCDTCCEKKLKNYNFMDQITEIKEKLFCKDENCEKLFNLKNFIVVCKCNFDKFDKKYLKDFLSEKIFKKYYKEIENDYISMLDIKTILDGIRLNENIIKIKKKELINLIHKLKNELNDLEKSLENQTTEKNQRRKSKDNLNLINKNNNQKLIKILSNIKDFNKKEKTERIVEKKGLERLKGLIKAKYINFNFVNTNKKDLIKNFENFVNGNKELENYLNPLKNFFFKNLDLMKKYKDFNNLDKVDLCLKKIKKNFDCILKEKELIDLYNNSNLKGFQKYYTLSCKKMANYCYETNPFYFVVNEDFDLFS